MKLWKVAAIGAAVVLALSGCVAQPDRTGVEQTSSPSTPAEAQASAPAPTLAADTEQLVGRWVEPDPPNPDAFVEFAEDGTWQASDGCNGASGTWNVSGGRFETAGDGGMTLIGCNNSVLPLPVWTAVTAEVDAGARVLVLTDADGASFELVRAD